MHRINSVCLNDAYMREKYINILPVCLSEILTMEWLILNIACMRLVWYSSFIVLDNCSLMHQVSLQKGLVLQ